MNEIDLFKLQQELSSLRNNNESLVERLRQRDAADIAARDAAKPKVNYGLQGAQRSVDDSLANPKALEELRAAAWSDWALSQTGTNFYRNRAPGDGSWPEGINAVSYVRKFHGLNDEGTALVGEKPVEPEETK